MGCQCFHQEGTGVLLSCSLPFPNAGRWMHQREVLKLDSQIQDSWLSVAYATEREKREKENLIAEMKYENTQLRESMQQQLNQSQISFQKELHRLQEQEETIRNLQYQN